MAKRRTGAVFCLVVLSVLLCEMRSAFIPHGVGQFAVDDDDGVGVQL